MMSGDRPLRIGLLGAGTFMRKAHIPSIQSLPDHLRVAAVCSRSAQTGREVAGLFETPVTVYTSLDEMLADDGIDAVDIALPIPLLPDAVRQCLSAGKHVISEKPIAPTCAEAKALIELYAKQSNLVWMVAENWRYEESFVAAGQAIRAGVIGRPLVCDWTLNLPVMPGAPGHRTTWRRSNDFAGGFLLDGGVHHVAGFRTVVGEIETVWALTAAHRPDLPPADSLGAAFRFVNGAVGSYSVTYAARSGLSSPALHVVGSEGSLRVAAGALTVWHEETGSEVQSFQTLRSVEYELADFARAIHSGTAHRNTPQEALQDLAVVEAMLTAAATGSQQTISPYTPIL